MSTQRYLTVAEVADRLSLSELTVRRKIAAGTIPAVRLAGEGRGAVRIPEVELDVWLRSARWPRTPDAA